MDCCEIVKTIPVTVNAQSKLPSVLILYLECVL